MSFTRAYVPKYEGQLLGSTGHQGPLGSLLGLLQPMLDMAEDAGKHGQTTGDQNKDSLLQHVLVCQWLPSDMHAQLRCIWAFVHC